MKIGIAGMGRLGQRHAENLRFKVHGANLVAGCSIVPEELEWARTALGITKLYSNYDEMVENAGLDAVFLVTPSSVHARQSIKALENGLHVFCEKPMGVNIEECRSVERAAAEHDSQVFFIGFVRRFDPSYAYAKKLIDQGAVGEPFMVRSQTVDLDEYAEFQAGVIAASGGIFLVSCHRS